MTETFSINFGNAKEFTKDDLPDEGTYTLKIVGYEVKQPKKVESQGKGVNVALVFTVEEMENDNFKIYHNVWTDFENPWGAKPFFEAVTGRELDDDLDISDPNYFLGEKVGCALVHEAYEKSNGKTGWKLSPAGHDAFYSV